MAILERLMQSRPEEPGFSADDLALLSSFASTPDDVGRETETQRVIRTLNDMAHAGILSRETTLSAYVRYKVQGSSEKRLKEICRVEKEFLKVLAEEAPDSEVETLLHLDLRQVNQLLLNQGLDCSSPSMLRLILDGWSRDGKGIAAKKGSISIRSRGNNVFSVMLHRDWQTLCATVDIRRRSAEIALGTIISSIAPNCPPGAAVLAEFTMEKIVAGLKHDLILVPLLKDPFAAAERALTFLHEQGVIALQQGLAVFRQAMTIRLNPEARGRRF